MRSAVILIVTAVSILVGFLLYRDSSRNRQRASRVSKTSMKLEGNQILQGPTIGQSLLNLPDRGLVDQQGNPVSFDQLTGTPTLLSFIYTRCPDQNMCPQITRKMVEIQKRMKEDPSRKVQFVAISFDPETDTPEVLRFYGKQFDVDFRNWSFWTGRPKTIKTITDRLRIATRAKPDTDTILHNMRTYLVDENLSIQTAWKGSKWSVDHVVRTLQSQSGPSDTPREHDR